MMKKTEIIFQEDVKNGYINYINFKRKFRIALETFKKYILPIETTIGIDANHDWIILIFHYDDKEENQEQLEKEWTQTTNFLKEEEIQYAYPSWYDEWSIIIPIDEFVEYVINKYQK